VRHEARVAVLDVPAERFEVDQDRAVDFADLELEHVRPDLPSDEKDIVDLVVQVRPVVQPPLLGGRGDRSELGRGDLHSELFSGLTDGCLDCRLARGEVTRG